jgi:putative transposase
MSKTFKDRPYPNQQQQRLLAQQVEECRWLHNHLLAARRDAGEQRQESLQLYDQQATLPALKAERPALAGVHSQVLQTVALRIDLAFKALFRRCKAGEEPGYPAFGATGATTASPSRKCRSAADWKPRTSACGSLTSGA